MKVTRSLQVVLLICICLASSLSALAQQWRPLDPAHLEQKAPTVEKDADAEALLWEVSQYRTKKDKGNGDVK
jgi:hypothetical protein